MAEVEINITPKIQSVNDAAKFAGDVMRNPPQSPVDMLKIADAAFNVSGVVAGGVVAAFPFAAPLLPLMSGIFSMFGGISGPSIGQITLEAIGQVSQQISAGFQAVTETINKVAEFQATRTIDTVLSGVTELAKEQSAVNVYKHFTADSILTNLEAEKALVFEEYTKSVNAERAAWVADIQAALEKAQAQTDAQYKLVQTQLAGIAGGVFEDLSQALNAAAAEGAEILEIQRQINEINGYLIRGELEAVAVQVVRVFYGVT